MKINKSIVLAFILTICMQHLSGAKHKSIRQPYPETGFWVTEYLPDEKSTIVRYYNEESKLVSQMKEERNLDITRRSVRKYLNKNLRSALSLNFTLNPTLNNDGKAN